MILTQKGIQIEFLFVLTEFSSDKLTTIYPYPFGKNNLVSLYHFN
jgi:hypothetical protein